MTLFKGAGVALVTPFHQDKNVNYEELEKLVEFQINNGIDAIIVCGTTGEPATMTMEERYSVISFVIERAKKRVPVIAGTGCNNTQTVIDFSKETQKIGADGLLIVTPYYNKATQNGLYAHYKQVADEVALPIILYNVPSRTGVNILPETAMRLAKDCSNIVGMKEASGNITQVADLIQKTEGLLDVYSGNDDQIVPILSLGGVGVISVLANIAPKQTHDIVMEYLHGNTKYATKLQLHYLDLIHTLFCEVNPIPVKKALEILGFEKSTLRMPLTELEEGHAKMLQEVIRNYTELFIPNKS
ncbi:MAG: 4-hydroxy-tetrahydrodipicolinate synthase [Lachnospiraceae bacterium]|nr:4-hydroxy-tetrahydrodipicolinate synthase [Lachnospiraceae bacterium]